MIITEVLFCIIDVLFVWLFYCIKPVNNILHKNQLKMSLEIEQTIWYSKYSSWAKWVCSLFVQ